MIRLETTNFLTRWFAWSCDHLPATTGYLPPEKEGGDARAKTGAWYVENGTTLCHLFWATLWAPLLGVAFVGFILSMIIMIHVEAHYEFVAKHPDYSPALQAAAYFFPELFLLGGVIAFGTVVLAVVGGSKTGFFSLLWQYLKGLKNRVCPLVKFEPKQL
jgi:hypothetical protein